MSSITVILAISNQEFLRLYRGQARDVICIAKDGCTVKFPADNLRQFITHDGIYGEFKLYFSKQNRLIKIERLDSNPRM